jgi:hypothetical protein
MGKNNYLTNSPAIATVAFQESAFFSKEIVPEHPLVRLPLSPQALHQASY